MSGLMAHFEREQAAHESVRTQRLQDAQGGEAIKDATDREIAALLHAKQAETDEARHLARLSHLVAQFEDRKASDAYNERVSKALARVQAHATVSALMALDRELTRQLEDEEHALLMLLAND